MLSHFQDSFASVLGFSAAIMVIGCLLLLLTKNPDYKTRERSTGKHFNRNQVLEDVVKAFEKAKLIARSHADTKLEDWVQSLKPNIDDFLDEHFNYFYQKKIGITSILSKSNLEKEVANRIEVSILSPTQMKRKIENILTQTVDVYALTLAQEFVEIQSKYKLSDVEWKEFNLELSQLTLEKGGIVYRFNNIAYWIELAGNSSAITGAVYGTKLLASSEAVVGFVGQQATGMLTKLGLKSAIKVGLGKAVTSLAAKVAAGWLAIFLIVASDIVSHNSYVSKQKPKLKKALLDQLQEIKTSLLEGNEYSIMSAITQIEYQTVKKSESSASNSSVSNTLSMSDSDTVQINAPATKEEVLNS